MIVIDMDMPKNCFECVYALTDAHGAYCALADNEIKEGLDIYEDTNNRSAICPIKCDIEQIRQEIDDLDRHYDNDYFSGNRDAMFKCNDVLQIIDKYKGDKE